jgi:hypothetical protein
MLVDAGIAQAGILIPLELLNNPEQSLHIRAIGGVLLAVRRFHFQLSTNCRQLKTIFTFHAGFHLKPIISRISAIRQGGYDINNRKIPGRFLFVI